MFPTGQEFHVTRDDSSLGRRSYLRAAGSAALAATLAGCGGWGPDDETTRSETTADETDRTPTTETTTGSKESAPSQNLVDRFGTVVNLAEEGASTSADEPINALLDKHAGDDTLLYFPPGRYRLREWRLGGHDNLGVVGDNAVLVPPDGMQNYWLQWSDLRNFLCSGFVLDGRGKNVAPVNHITVSGGKSVVRNVALRGHRRVPRSGFEIAVTNPDAELLFEKVRAPDGSTAGNGIYTFPRSVGKLTLKDCVVEHWAEGLYASPHSGPLEVLGGYYANNGIDQVRVGGGPNGAVVRNVTVRVDNPKQADSKPNMRGIWMEEGGNMRVQNCDVELTDVTGTYSDGAIVIGQQSGAATIENTRIRVDVDAPAIQVQHPIDSMKGQTMPSMESLPESVTLTCRDVRIAGNAPSGTAVLAEGRNGCVFENVCIQQREGSRDGIRVVDAKDCAVRDSTIAVSGDAIITEGASVKTSNVRKDGSCGS